MNSKYLIFFLGVLFWNFSMYSQDRNSFVECVFDIHLDKKFQTIDNFGASDAWSTQYVGNWPEKQRNRIAELLFSKEVDEKGNPQGIGLSAWRFNIGAGSFEQGIVSGINDLWHKTECFIDKSGTYNWNKQSGQQWFLKKAKELGVKTFVGFNNSPPVFFTKNNQTYSSDGIASNLKEAYYDDYADFLTQVVIGIKANTGVDLDYISPFNEPQWEWLCCKQEGSPWKNEEILRAVIEIDKSFRKNGIQSKIDIPETAQINYLYESKGSQSKGNQVDYFFNPLSAGYVGNLKTVAKKVSGHSYFSTWPETNLIHSRKRLSEKITSIDSDLNYWMSEYCILEDNSMIKGKGVDLGMDAALYMARVIHADLVYANASAWQWWLAISPFNYKDGLIYIDKSIDGGIFKESKMLWTLGHFSRFIRPGMERVEVKELSLLNDELHDVLMSAYLSKDQLVLVLINQSTNTRKIILEGISSKYNHVNAYITTANSNENLNKIDLKNPNNFEMIERSIMTIVFSNDL